VRFLVDENGGLVVPNWLRSLGHEVFSVYESARGIDDDEVIQKAFDENWILISSDKDFGNKVFREHRPHRGVIKSMSMGRLSTEAKIIHHTYTIEQWNKQS
jgi:predicted nuclease of predicted toxin-antitoxin system